MLAPEQHISQSALVGYVEYRGYQTQAACRPGEAAPYGYALVGPRGNKGFVPVERDGTCRLFTARLWCDAVDYANQIAAARQSVRRISRNNRGAR